MKRPDKNAEFGPAVRAIAEKIRLAKIPRLPHHLLISVDHELLNCAFVWTHRGELPVMYPLATFSHALSEYRGQADLSLGKVCFPVPASEIVKVDFFPEKILAFVQEWLTIVRAEGACATPKEGAD